jgi:hypothetical protein
MKKKKKDHEPTHGGLRDGAGHLSADVTAHLLAQSRRDGAAPEEERSFFPGTHSDDPLAERLGESFVAAATSGEDASDEALAEIDVEESGGPFVETDGKTEFAADTDASNPADATREPFPRT